MGCNILTIADSMVEPPSELMAFRTVTMMSHLDFHMEILFHTTQELKDLYFQWLKLRGLMDYIDYILTEQEWEDGVRIDNIKVYPRTVVTKFIRLENQLIILNQVKSLIDT